MDKSGLGVRGICC